MFCKKIPRYKIMGKRIYAFVNQTDVARNVSQWRLIYFTPPPAAYNCLIMFYIYFCSLFLMFMYMYCLCCIFNMKELAFFFFLFGLVGFEQIYMEIEKFPGQKGKFDILEEYKLINNVRSSRVRVGHHS